MNRHAIPFSRSRRPIALSLLFAFCSVSYLLYLGVPTFFLIRIGNIGDAFGEMRAQPEPHPLRTFFTLSYFLAPLLYFVSSYLCWRPQVTGRHLRRVFIASLCFLALSVISFGFGTPLDSFNSRTSIVIGALLMATPFIFASDCILYARWRPHSNSTNDA